MPQIINAGVLDAALTGSEIFPFQEAAGGAGSTKHTALDTLATYIRGTVNIAIIAASDSPAIWKALAGTQNTMTGTNDGGRINAIVGTIPGTYGITGVSPLTAPKYATILYAPGTYNISTDAILMRTGVTHKSLGGEACTTIKAVKASCRGLFMLYDGNVHQYIIDGFNFEGNGAAGAGDGTTQGANPIIGCANAIWIDHRDAEDAAFTAEAVGAPTRAQIAATPALGFKSTSYTGKKGLWTGVAYVGTDAYGVGDLVGYPLASSQKYVAIQAGTGHQPDISPTFWTAVSGGGCSVDWNGTAYITSLCDTAAQGNSKIRNLSGNRFVNASYSGGSYNRRFAIFARNSTNNAPCGNGYALTEWSLGTPCDGTMLEINGCADGHASGIHTGSSQVDWCFVFNCASWRFFGLKGYFAKSGGFWVQGSRMTFVACHAQDNGATGAAWTGTSADEYGWRIEGPDNTFIACEADSNSLGWYVGSDRTTLVGSTAFNRNGGNNSQQYGIVFATNRSNLNINLNASDAFGSQIPVKLQGSTPNGLITVQGQGGTVTRYGQGLIPASYMKPTSSYESYPRTSGIADRAALATGRVSLQAIQLPAGLVVTNLTFASITTPAGTPTHWWFSLCDSTYTTLRSTADQTTTAWAANTVMTKALSSTFTTTYEGLYYVGIMMAATTPVSLAGQAINSTVNGILPYICLNGSSTTLTTAPPDGTLFAVGATPASSFGLWTYAT